jgi:hypothetical protein
MPHASYSYGNAVKSKDDCIHFIATCNQHSIKLAVPDAFGVKQGYARKKSLCIVGGPVFEFCVIFIE